MQDAATFEMAIETLGGAEIEGPGERPWWMADCGTMASAVLETLLVPHTSRGLPSPVPP